MNFLAHLYLSGHDADLRVGNFIGDHVKGRDYDTYPDRIREGILLHRQIDEFTDKHDLVKQGASRFKPRMGRYASVVIDVVFDHFLASRWERYSLDSLREFSDNAFADLESNFEILPEKVKRFLPLMKASDRLVGYSKIEGLHEAIDRMSKHTSLPSEPDFVVEVVEQNLTEYIQEFSLFFDEVIGFVEAKIGQTIARPM